MQVMLESSKASEDRIWCKKQKNLAKPESSH